MWQACAKGGSRQEGRCESVSFSVEPRDDLFQVADHSPPAVGGALVETLVFRPEARLLHAHERAGLRRRKRPRDDSSRSRRCLFARSVPAIGTHNIIEVIDIIHLYE